MLRNTVFYQLLSFFENIRSGWLCRRYRLSLDDFLARENLEMFRNFRILYVLPLKPPQSQSCKSDSACSSPREFLTFQSICIFIQRITSPSSTSTCNRVPRNISMLRTPHKTRRAPPAARRSSGPPSTPGSGRPSPSRRGGCTSGRGPAGGAARRARAGTS